jgi:hypothetical protein
MTLAQSRPRVAPGIRILVPHPWVRARRAPLGFLLDGLRVHGDVVHDMKLTGKATRTSDAAEDRVGRAVHNAHLVVDAIDHEQRRLLTIG